MFMKLVISSKNLHKIRETRAILKQSFNYDFLSLKDFPDYTPPKETGATFEENAFLKAIHAAKTLKSWVLADDSGLVIPSLNSEPGIKSSRFAGETATDKENREKLIQALEKLEESQRTGYFVCALALASPEGLIKQVQASCEGRLLISSKGSGGFGYDSLFIKYDYNKTLAQLDEETKNRISHRRKALEKLSPTLESLITT